MGEQSDYTNEVIAQDIANEEDKWDNPDSWDMPDTRTNTGPMYLESVNRELAYLDTLLNYL